MDSCLGMAVPLIWTILRSACDLATLLLKMGLANVHCFLVGLDPGGDEMKISVNGTHYIVRIPVCIVDDSVISVQVDSTANNYSR